MTIAGRPTPYELVFGELAAGRFQQLQRGLTASGCNAGDREAFLLAEDVVGLLRELRPDEGLGESVTALVALVHAAYLYWLDGEHLEAVDLALLNSMLTAPWTTAPAAPAARTTRYLQLPAHRVWGVPVAEAPAEPLDGWFVTRSEDGLSVVAVFGVHPGRDGFTVVTAAGHRPQALAREDGTPLFAPRLPGGSEAGLASLLGEEELLELAWRLEESA